MAKEIYGVIKTYSTDRGVSFDFHELDKKDTDSDQMVYNVQNIPFLIWSKFKNKKVKITIEKAE